jgi:hypothetical protein
MTGVAATGHGTCRQCRRRIALRKDGRLRGHNRLPYGASYYNRGCPGTGTLPAETASHTILSWPPDSSA